jgi:hypothetical protein
MRTLWLGVAFLAASSCVFGQLDDNTVTITASRNISLQPDFAVVGIYVDAPYNDGLDDILNALDGSGLTADDLTGVNTSGPLSEQVQRTAWTFARAVPFAKLKDMLASLTAVQQGLAGSGTRGAANASVSMTFSVQGSQVSPELQASQPCPLPALVSDARAQAQQLAMAAGFTVGPVVAISDGSSTGGTYGAVLGAVFGLAAGAISVSRIGTFSSLITQPPVNCSMTVQFQLLH